MLKAELTWSCTHLAYCVAHHSRLLRFKNPRWYYSFVASASAARWMSLISMLRGLAKALRQGGSSEVTVADLRLENTYYFNDDLKRWCKLGEGHKAEDNQRPPSPPIAKIGTGPVSGQRCRVQIPAKHKPFSAADALIVPPHLFGKRSAISKHTVSSVPTQDATNACTSPVDESKRAESHLLHSDKAAKGGGSGASDSKLAIHASKLHSEVPHTPCLAELCGCTREAPRQVTASRRAGVARKACESAWYVCSQHTAHDGKYAGEACRQSSIEAALTHLEQYEHLRDDLLLLSLRALWRATFEAAAVDLFVELGGLRKLSSVMLSPSGRHVGIQTAACGMLRNVAEDKFHRAAIIRANGQMLIVSAMQQNSDDNALLRIACQALYGLALCSDYQRLIVKAGGGIEAQKLALRSMPHGQVGCRVDVVNWGLRLHEIMDYGLA
eukprot:TRINITY_DN23564_c0_g1_i1.p1 TRINITY_DN23564_c0_g1~~TRINITY_DN23564_c0_g1_i1.p1  ORF type:complete len:440 (-),score=65.25 TRINITY_DN23564_c0_g1_i1:502-1821(-)